MGGGGQRGSTTTVQSAGPQIPPELSPLITQSAGAVGQAQQQAPGLTSLLNPTPQQIPGLSPIEQLLSSLQLGFALPGGGTQISDASGSLLPTGGSLTAPGNATSPEVAALQQIAQLTGGPIGSSPATQQGIGALENQFQTETLPTLQNQLMLAGLGNSGALGESLARARSGVSAATVPLLQQEVANRGQAVNQLQQLGGTFAGRERGDVATALQSAGVSRQLAEAQSAANFADEQRRQALIEQLNLGVLGVFGPSTIGTAGTGMQRFNTAGAGLLGSLIGGSAK